MANTLRTKGRAELASKDKVFLAVIDFSVKAVVFAKLVVIESTGAVATVSQ
jgi:hypothetical protein